jgi:hypothetical protein
MPPYQFHMRHSNGLIFFAITQKCTDTFLHCQLFLLTPFRNFICPVSIIVHHFMTPSDPSGVTEGVLGGSNPPPPKFRSFDKAEPNSQFRGKYMCNNLIRIRVSLICKLSGTPDLIPILSALCPQMNLLNPHSPNKIPGYATE